MQILDALELGASATIDLHRYFQVPERSLYRRYRVREFCVIGSQVRDSWLPGAGTLRPRRWIRRRGARGGLQPQLELYCYCAHLAGTPTSVGRDRREL